MARATSSLPVPVSPVISTVVSVAATLSTRREGLAQGRRGADDLLEHGALVDLLAQGQVLGLELAVEPRDLLEGEGVGHGGGDRPRERLEDVDLVRREGAGASPREKASEPTSRSRTLSGTRT